MFYQGLERLVKGQAVATTSGGFLPFLGVCA